MKVNYHIEDITDKIKRIVDRYNSFDEGYDNSIAALMKLDFSEADADQLLIQRKRGVK